MKLLLPTFNSFLKNKKIIIYFIAISITLGIILSIIYNTYQINMVFSEKVKNNIVNRIIYIYGNEDIVEKDLNVISSIKGIEGTYYDLNNLSVQLEGNYSFLTKYVLFNEELPKIIHGTIFNNDYQMQIILPCKILNKNGQYEYLDKLVGKNIDLTLEDFKANVKIVGTYDNTNYDTYVFVNDKLKKSLKKYNELCINKNYLKAVVNNYDDVEYVVNTLKDNGYYVDIPNDSGQLDVKLYNMATILITIMIGFTIVFVYVAINIMIKDIINGEKLDIAILKAIGYKIKDLYIIVKNRILFVIEVSSLLGVIISYVMNYLIVILIEKKLSISLDFDFYMYLKIFVIFFVGINIISFVSVKGNSWKLKKINTIDLLKEN